MKPVFRLAAAFALAPLALGVVTPSPALAQEDPNVYWDPKIVKGSEPYALNGSDTTGKKLNLADYKGKVLVLDFWATWCGPCVHEIPTVLETYKKYHDQGLEILGISLDNKKEDLDKFMVKTPLPWAQVLDRELGKEGNANHYGVKAIPFVLVIGKDGKVAAVNARGDDLEPAIKEALAK